MNARVIIINSDIRNTLILPNILLIDIGKLEYEDCTKLIENVTWYKKIGIVENFQEMDAGNFIKLHQIIKPDHFYNHLCAGEIEIPNYQIIKDTSCVIFEYLITSWEVTALLDKHGRFYRLWLDLRHNYTKYISEAIIKEIVE